jgi:hypothetical protein
MERARIYGGINLRAAHIGGMFHLNDALLRSPLAHFEYILLKTLTLIAQKGNEGLLNEAGSLEAAKKHPSWVQLSPTFPQSLSHGAVEAIAAQLHPDAIDKKRDPLWISKEDHGDLHAATERRKWERLGGSFKNETAIGDGSRLQEYLMSGDLATAEAALRAEQLKVEGPIYARGLRTSGRIRLKHLIANGNLSLNGSRLRSAKDIGIGLWFLRKMLRTEKEILESSGEHKEAMGVVKCVKGLPKRHHARLKRSYRTSLKLLSENEEKWLISPEANDKDRLSDYVIDLDHARIKGDVDFSYDTRINRTVQKHEEAFKDALKSISDELLKF